MIRYPRETDGTSRKRGELDLRLSSGPIPAEWKNCSEACRCQTRNQDIGIGIEVVDQKTHIVKNQQEFSGSRSFGITDVRGAMDLITMGSLAWSFNDNESKEITTFTLVPKELEKVIAEKGGSITQMRNLGIGINKGGSNGSLTWKIEKVKFFEPAKKKDPCTILTTRLLEIDAIIKAYSDEKLFEKFKTPNGKLSDSERADMYQKAVEDYFNELMNNKESASKGGSGNVKTLLTANGNTLTITYEKVIVVNGDESINLSGYNEAMNGFIVDCGNRSAGIALFSAALEHEKDHIANFRQGKWGDDPEGLRDLELSAYKKEREQLLKDLEIIRKRGDCK